MSKGKWHSTPGIVYHDPIQPYPLAPDMATITFFGAAQEVTGSCHLVESPAIGRVLLDCGMRQGGDDRDDADEKHFDFAPDSIDALILSHAHIDHSGMIPLLVHKGFKGPIYCTRATCRLLKVMLEDAVGIYEKDFEYENLRRLRRGDKPLKPAWTRDDVHKALKLCEPIRYRECFPIAGGTLCFHDAGHIIGSAIVELKFREDGKDKTLVFSGDLGNSNSALMNDPVTLKEADIVLMEGTYGDRNHRSQQASLVELEAILQETWDMRGNVMIPAFSVGRTQELLFHLGTMAADGRLDNWQVYVDSPMATEVTTLYEACMDILDQEDVQKMKQAYGASLKKFLPNLHFTSSVEESMAINRVKHGSIIIAGSGMCTGGRIRHHFKQRIWEQRNTIIFVGFQAWGTLGRKLVDGVKKISMFGSEFAVRARIETINGFSAHAGQSDLTNWIAAFENKPRVVLVHGEADTLKIFAEHLRKELGIKAQVPELGETVQF
jgi:metallo-beta-lactamase family protein